MTDNGASIGDALPEPPISKAEWRILKGALAAWPPTSAKSVSDYLSTPICGQEIAEYAEKVYGLRTLNHVEVVRMAERLRDFVLQEHPPGDYTPFGRAEAFLLAGHMLFGTAFQAAIDGGPRQRGSHLDR